MSYKMKHATLALAAALTLGVTGTAAAEPATLRVATSAPQKTVWANQLDRLAADVAEASKGDLKLEVFYNSQLGGEQDALSQLIRGRIDMMFASNVGVSSQEPAAIVTQLYYFYDPAERDCVLDKHMYEPMRELLAKKNIQFLGWYEAGSVGLASKRKMTSPADIKNVKLAYSPSKFATDFWKLYGAVPVATPVPEVTSSIGTGLTDGYPNQPVLYVAAGINKVAPVWNSNVPSGISPGLLIASKSSYDKLSASQREALNAAIAKVPASQIRAEVKQFEAVMLKKHTDAGGQIFDITPEELAEWKKPLGEFYAREMKSMGPVGEKLFAQAQAAKAACKK